MGNRSLRDVNLTELIMYNWSNWFYFVFNLQSPYFLSWWCTGGQKYGFFDIRVSSKNTARVGILMRYESFFAFNRDAGMFTGVEFTASRQYGLYYFLNNTTATYVSSAVPALDMRKIYSKILTNRRFLRISLRTLFFRSKKLTQLLKWAGLGIRHSVSVVTIKEILVFVLKVFTFRECSWFIHNGLVRVNSRVMSNDGYSMRCGDIFSWTGGVFFFCHVLYFRFNLSKWLWRKRRRTVKKLTKFVFYGGAGYEGWTGLGRLQKTTYTGGMYWGAEWDYRLCLGVIFFDLQSTVSGLLNNKEYALRNFNVWAFTH